ncbi:MAG: tail fiber domain-containing protein [Candidatus Omnitrophota bacterium]
MRKIMKAAGILLLFFLVLAGKECPADDESITIATYYPSPYGSYNELSAWKMKVGSTYSGSAVAVSNDNLIVEGMVGIGKNNPSQKLDVAGNAAVSGNATVDGNVTATAFYYSSDTKLKTDIKPIEDPLAKVLRLQGVSFRWKAGSRESLGFLAQDIEREFPDLVMTNPEGVKYVQYGNLVAPLVEAIKEQQKKIESLEKKIQSLR